MTAPKRIQRRRTAGWLQPGDAPYVYVGRPSRFGNPYRATATTGRSELWCGDEFIGQSTDPTWAQREAVRRFAQHAAGYDTDTLRRDLAGKNLACWCRLDQPCHADVLLRIANNLED